MKTYKDVITPEKPTKPPQGPVPIPPPAPRDNGNKISVTPGDILHVQYIQVENETEKQLRERVTELEAEIARLKPVVHLASEELPEMRPFKWDPKSGISRKVMAKGASGGLFWGAHVVWEDGKPTWRESLSILPDKIVYWWDVPPTPDFPEELSHE
jgi:hypothetical protein